MLETIFFVLKENFGSGEHDGSLQENCWPDELPQTSLIQSLVSSPQASCASLVVCLIQYNQALLCPTPSWW